MDQKLTPVALISQVGLTMAGSILVGILVGLWLDHRFGTTPLFILLFSLFGISAGSIAVYRLVARSITAAADVSSQRTTPEEERAADEQPAAPSEREESERASSSDDAMNSTKSSIDREKS